MAYIDPKFLVPVQDTVIGSPAVGVTLGTIGTNGTATMTGTAGTQVNGSFRFPVFKSPIKVDGIRCYTTVAPGAGVTALVSTFYNGTTVFGTATYSSTVGFVDATIVADTISSNGSATSGAYFTSTTSNEITMQTVGIGTASGSALGSYAIDLIWRDLFTQ